jgi:hypothetical protein
VSDAGDRRRDRRDSFLLWLSTQKAKVSKHDCLRYLQVWTGLKASTIESYFKEWHTIGLIKISNYGNVGLTPLAERYLRSRGQAI